MAVAEGRKNAATSPLERELEIRFAMQTQVCNIPRKLQLAKTNVTCRVVVASRSKFDILRLISVSEPNFCCLVEAMDNVIEVIDIFRVREVFWMAKMNKDNKGRL